MSQNDTYNYKLERIKYIQNSSNNPYPHKFIVTTSINEIIINYSNSLVNGEKTSKMVSIAGRILSKRSGSNKLYFYDLFGNGTKIQIVANFKDFNIDHQNFKDLNDNTKRGDIVGFSGFIGKTNIGELSVFSDKIVSLSPCLYMLPKREDVNDKEIILNREVRFDKRYLDGIVNAEHFQNIFKKRHQIIKYIRNFLDERDFIEVQTPVLSSNAGGAIARPFTTHHHELNVDLHLRIAPELYLKQLVIAGLERVYEIGSNFRNEGIDQTHNPEFTSIEIYQAYADYNDMMTFTESLISSLIFKFFGKYTINYGNVLLDFSTPWKRYDIIKILSDKLKVSFPDDLSLPSSTSFIDNLCLKNNIECANPRTSARLLDKLIDKFIEKNIISPSFVINHPKVMSPLAKQHRDNINLTERFELFINSMELCNSYTEQNNPDHQRAAFELSSKSRQEGSIESMNMDEKFLTALEYGLPPTAGWGLGIDRLVMIITNTHSIREVLTFSSIN